MADLRSRDMAGPLLVYILCRKRDKIRDTVATYGAKLEVTQVSFAHVNATLHLF